MVVHDDSKGIPNNLRRIMEGRRVVGESTGSNWCYPDSSYGLSSSASIFVGWPAFQDAGTPSARFAVVKSQFPWREGGSRRNWLSGGRGCGGEPTRGKRCAY